MALQALSSRAIRGYLFQELETPPMDWVQNVAGPVLRSDQGSEKYVGVGNVQGLRKWVGQRFAQGLSTQEIEIFNDKYEDTLSVWGNEWRRDKTGQVLQRIGEMRERYNYHWWKLVNQALVDNPTTYDGTALFATTHSDGVSGTLNNDIDLTAASTTVPTAAEMSTGILQMITAMQGFKDNQGEPINIGANSFTLIYPTVLHPQVVTALSSQFLAAAGNVMVSNPLNAILPATTITPVSNPYLTSAVYMYLVRNTGRLLIRQSELDLQVTSLAEGSELEHKEDRHEYGIMTIRGIGPGRYQHGIRGEWT